jgi:hypothetical protein
MITKVLYVHRTSSCDFINITNELRSFLKSFFLTTSMFCINFTFSISVVLLIVFSHTNLRNERLRSKDRQMITLLLFQAHIPHAFCTFKRVKYCDTHLMIVKNVLKRLQI